MKLFLASSLDKTLSLLKPLLSDVIKTRVVFVANAADPYNKDKWWVDLDRERFKEFGYKITEVDLRNTSKDEFSNILKDADILHVCGGSVFYLINLIRKKNLEEIFIKAIKNEEVIYTGTSAGSIIVSKSIASFSYDEEEKEFIEAVPDKLGLGLINFGIVPHCNNADFIDGNKKTIEYLHKDKNPLIFIQDNQAVWVEDDKFKIISI